MESNFKMDRLVDKFKSDAEKLGFSLEAVALIQNENKHLYVNWNDEAGDEEKLIGSEAVALALCMFSCGDKELINDSLRRAYIHTPQGADQFRKVMADSLAEAIGAGIQIGKQSLKELQSDSPGLPAVEEVPQITEGKE